MIFVLANSTQISQTEEAVSYRPDFQIHIPLSVFSLESAVAKPDTAATGQILPLRTEKGGEDMHPAGRYLALKSRQSLAEG